MKTILTTLISTIALSSVLADVPENYPPSRYIDLYRNSAITDEPEPEIIEKEDPKLDEWTLVGLRKYHGNYEVTILNTKDRTNRLVIPSTKATEEGFAIKEVNYKRALQSEVTLQKGSATGVVSFDPKYLVLKAVAAPAGNKKSQASSSTKRTNTNTKGGAPPVPGAKPPVPGSKPSTSSKSTTGKVPVPKTSGSTASSSSSTKSSGRTRYVPRPKK